MPPRFDRPPFDRPPFDRPALIFCATQRSGSTLAVDDFQNLTGRRLSQTEGFYHLVLARKDAAQKDPTQKDPAQKDPAMTWDRAMAILAEHRRDEAVFFDKVMFHYLPQLSRMIDPGRHDAICTPFAEYFAGATWVHIRRADIFGQVVSKYLADTLGVWNARDVKTADFNARVDFDLDRARGYLRNLLREDQQWRNFFARHGIRPIQIHYEDAVGNYPGYLAPVFAALGLAVDLSGPPPRRMEKVGNERNRVLAQVLRDMVLRDLIANSFEMRDFFRDRFL